MNSFEIWEAVSGKFPGLLPLRSLWPNHCAVQEIVLGGSVNWRKVHERFTPTEDSSVLDLGANVGIFSAFCAIHGAQVTAYEPFEAPFEHLREVAKRIPGIVALHRAVGPISGECKIFGSTQYPEPNARNYNGTADFEGCPMNEERLRLSSLIPCDSLDLVCAKTWDMVKMDVEGSETETILMASDEALRNIKSMYLEVHPWADPDRQTMMMDKLRSLFTVEDLDESSFWVVKKESSCA
jgi:FkbM family methyltransferase